MNNLEQKYRFKSHSQLHLLLAEYCSVSISCPVKITIEEEDYSLWEVASAFFYMVKVFELYDHQNPSIIILDGPFERALGVKSFHIGDSARWLQTQLEKPFEFVPDSLLHQLLVSVAPAIFTSGVHIYPEAEVSAYLCGLFKEEGFAVELQSLVKQTPRKTSKKTLPICWGDPFAIAARAQKNFNAETFNKNGRYLVKPDLLDFLRRATNVDPEQEVFQFTEIKRAFARYFLQNKALFLDPRNASIAYVESTPLGAALGVRAFHRSQTWALISSQLIEMGSAPIETPAFKKPLPPSGGMS